MHFIDSKQSNVLYFLPFPHQSETSSVQTYVEAHQDPGHHKRSAEIEADHHSTNGDDHHDGDPYGDHGHGFTFQVETLSKCWYPQELLSN